MIKKIIADIILPVIAVLTLIFIGYWIIFPEENDENSFISFQNSPLPYHISYPEKIIELPQELKEISGISYYKPGKLACNDDEHGNVYIVNYQTGEITGVHKFGKNRDYEDIAVMMDTIDDMVMKIYVLRSNGKIYRIKRLGLSSQKVKEYDTTLSSYYDAEGLCYDKETNALLVACRHSPKLSRKRKGIYSFDLYNKVMQADPRFVIDFTGMTDESGNPVHSNKKFQPSGIAIHPFSGDFYIISSVGNVLVVLNKEGKIKNVTPLNKKLLQQPEGICFLPNGDMLISSEGRTRKGTLVQFTYNQQE